MKATQMARTLSAGSLALLLFGCASGPQSEPEASGSLDVTAYVQINEWPLESNPKAFALADDGSFLLASDNELERNELVKIDLATGERTVMQIDLSFFPVTAPKALAISPDGERFVVNWPSWAVVIDTATGSVEDEIDLGNEVSTNSMTSFNELDFAPDGTAVVGIGGDVVRMDLSGASATAARDLPLVGSARSGAAIDAQTAISSGWDGASWVITIGRAGARAPSCTFEGRPNDLAISADGNRLAGVLYVDGKRISQVVVWDIANCSKVADWWAPTMSAAIAWLPDGERVATATMDGRLVFWDASSGSELHALQAHPEGNFLFDLSEDGRTLVTLNPWNGKAMRLFEIAE